MNQLNFYENNEMDKKVTLYVARFNFENGKINDFTPIIDSFTCEYPDFHSIDNNPVGFKIKINEDDEAIYLFEPQFEQLYFYNSLGEYFNCTVVHPSTNNDLSFSKFKNKVMDCNMRICIQTRIKETFYHDFSYKDYLFIMNTINKNDNYYFSDGKRYEIREFSENSGYQSFICNQNKYLPFSEDELMANVSKWEINLENVITSTMMESNSLKNDNYYKIISAEHTKRIIELINLYKYVNEVFS